MSKIDFQFKIPFTCIVAGMTSSGKTILVRQFLNNWKNLININENILKVLWCYGQMQELYNKNIENVEIIYNKGLPSLEYIQEIKPNLIVLDDLMDNITNEIKDLFTKTSHHLNISVIFIVQNIFNQNKYMRTISLNSHYIIILKGARITQQVTILSRQIFPNKSKEVTEIFKAATAKPFGYLLFDLHPQSNDKYRLRTRIFKEEVPKHLQKFHSFSPIYYKI